MPARNSTLPVSRKVNLPSRVGAPVERLFFLRSQFFARLANEQIGTAIHGLRTTALSAIILPLRNGGIFHADPATKNASFGKKHIIPVQKYRNFHAVLSDTLGVHHKGIAQLSPY